MCLRSLLHPLWEARFGLNPLFATSQRRSIAQPDQKRILVLGVSTLRLDADVPELVHRQPVSCEVVLCTQPSGKPRLKSSCPYIKRRSNPESKLARATVSFNDQWQGIQLKS